MLHCISFHSYVRNRYTYLFVSDDWNICSHQYVFQSAGSACLSGDHFSRHILNWHTPYPPWCWYIYLHDWVMYGVNVGKYSSTMEHMGTITPRVFWVMILNESDTFETGGGWKLPLAFHHGFQTSTLRCCFKKTSKTGWWCNVPILKNMKVKWDDDIPN